MTRFYFCHSYYFLVATLILRLIWQNTNFIYAAFNFQNIYGVQFHPEKSYNDGSKLINNFYEID